MPDQDQDAQPNDTTVNQRTGELQLEHQMAVWKRTDRLFAWLLTGQWIAGIALAFWLSPRTWAGASSSVHPHVFAAIFLGGIIIAMPVALAVLRPGWFLTRHVVAAGQIMFSGLLIHLGDGRIEMHFHIFGSLAFLAFYRDWRVLITASVITAADHFVRGIYLPESVFGVASATLWRPLEHAGWVLFEDVFLVTACVQGVREMNGIAHNQALLERSHRDVEVKVQERTLELKNTQADLVKVARSAGMAEIATSVLHNVGNVLNSVNVSATVIAEKLRNSEVDSLTKVGEMIRENKADLPQFLTNDERGRMIPDFLGDLADCLGEEHRMMLGEITSLATGIDHIKQIVIAQQSMGKKSVMNSLADPRQLMETAVSMQSSLQHASIQVIREFQNVPSVQLDQHKVLQVLINLISNAAHAMMDSKRPAKRVTLGVELIQESGSSRVRFRVADNGNGIAPDNLSKIFSHGFTTKKDGHGFGLHSAVNAAREMNGTLSATSEGIGHGAVFTLEIPVESIRTATIQAGETCKL